MNLASLIVLLSKSMTKLLLTIPGKLSALSYVLFVAHTANSSPLWLYQMLEIASYALFSLYDYPIVLRIL
jgi:hypothetical protein